MAKKQIEQTEIEAPYELPEGWKWCRLGELCSTFTDGDWIESKDQASDGIRLIQTGNIGNGIFRDKEDKYHYISQVTFEKLNCTEIYAGDILISRLPEPVGRSCIIPQNTYRMITAVDCTIIRLNEKVTSKGWFCLYTQSPIYNDLVHSACTGTTRQRISRSNLGNIAIPLPPTLEEQQRIVNRIETLFAKLDQAKEKAQNVVDTFETRKASILHKAFTGELTKKWREENGVGENSWVGKKLEEISLKIGDGLHGTPIYAENGKFAFINGNNFSNDHIEIKSDTKYVDEDEYKKHFIELFVDKTVFVSINGTLGKTAFFNDEKVILGKSACYINVKNEFLSKHFLKRYFETKEFIDYANEKATGSTIKNLGLRAIRDLIIMLPSLSEQKEIVRILDCVLEKENKAKQAAIAVLEQIDLLKKSILARAFRGEL